MQSCYPAIFIQGFSGSAADPHNQLFTFICQFVHNLIHYEEIYRQNGFNTCIARFL